MDSEAAPVIGRAGSYAKGIARRSEILDRAIEVFAMNGAQGTSLRQIAQRLGVSHAALLHYFDSREQLLLAVYEHAEMTRARAADKSAGQAAGEAAGQSAVEVLVHAAMGNIQVPGLVQLYSTLLATSIEADSKEGKAFFTHRFDIVRADLTQRLERDQAAGWVRADVDAADIAAILTAASDGLQIQWLLDPSIALERTLRTFAVLLTPS